MFLTWACAACVNNNNITTIIIMIMNVIHKV